METAFICFTQGDSKDAIMQECSAKELLGLTMIEDAQFYIDDELGEYFIYCMN
jgi:hypothetical protein